LVLEQDGGVNCLAGACEIKTDIAPVKGELLVQSSSQANADLKIKANEVKIEKGGRVRLTSPGGGQPTFLTINEGKGTLLNAGSIEVVKAKERANSILASLDNSGTVTIDSGSIIVHLGKDPGNAHHNRKGGKIELKDSHVVVKGKSFENHKDALISGPGTMDVSGVDWKNSGKVEPLETVQTFPGGKQANGYIGGVLDFIGDYSQTDEAALAISIGADPNFSAQPNDLLRVTGSTQLDGMLLVSLFDYLPRQDDMFTVLLSSGPLTGSFSSSVVQLPGVAFEIIYGAYDVRLRAMQNFVPQPDNVVPEPATAWLMLGIIAIGCSNFRLFRSNP
jgi:hypothetical protein